MTTTERLMPAVDRIYAAAAREIPLDAALHACADAAGDSVAALFLHSGDGQMSLIAAAGVDAARREAHNRRWRTGNPLLRRGFGELTPGRFVSLDELVHWPDFVETDYYCDFFQALDCRHGVGTRIAASGAQLAWLLSARGAQAGPHAPAQLSLLGALRPHLARALHLLESFEGVAAIGDGVFRHTVDSLPFSVLLLDDARRVLYANRRAQARLQNGDGFVDMRGRLGVGGPGRDTFETGWTAMVADPLRPARQFSLRGSGESPPLDLDVTRFPPAGAGAPAARVWLLRARDAPVSRRELSAGWAVRFGLTATECKVGLALLAHADAAAIAATLRIADNTVRAHLKTLFAKVGVRSQTALVLALSPPLRMID